MIGMVRDDATVRAIYCHWDGYPAHVGILLKAFYDTADTLTALLDRGDVSSLGSTLEETTFYRGRGEDDVFAKEFTDIAEAVEYYTGSWCEYFYIFEDGIWTVRDRHGMNRSLAGVLEDLRESVKE
jgi:hypothetical protein